MITDSDNSYVLLLAACAVQNGLFLLFIILGLSVSAGVDCDF